MIVGGILFSRCPSVFLSIRASDKLSVNYVLVTLQAVSNKLCLLALLDNSQLQKTTFFVIFFRENKAWYFM